MGRRNHSPQFLSSSPLGQSLIPSQAGTHKPFTKHRNSPGQAVKPKESNLSSMTGNLPAAEHHGLKTKRGVAHPPDHTSAAAVCWQHSLHYPKSATSSALDRGIWSQVMHQGKEGFPCFTLYQWAISRITTCLARHTSGSLLFHVS